MPSYRIAKTAELDILFDWLADQLRQLRQANPDHRVILDHLDQQYNQAETKLALLQTLLALKDPNFDKRADKLAHDLSRYVVPTANHYIAGLQRQGPEDRRVRGVLLRLCKRLRLDWIEDILVCLRRDLALLAEYRGIFAIPVFFGPPHLLETILEVPGIYHEFGHSVFARDDVFFREMSSIVKRHFAQLKQQAGPIPPAQKALRDQELDRAASSWSALWLAEIFCDLFAGYVCGPANLASMVDLGRAQGFPPYLLASNSHPPNGARVSASYFALSDQQRQHSTVQKIHDAWQNFARGFTPGQDYKLRCAEDLLRSLADAVNALIAQHLPNIPRYTKMPADLTAARGVKAGIELEDLINAGVTILFEAPHEFPKWQQSSRLLIS
ncbi:MAG: hypothetical protein ABS95_01295 [Verrucomicrobia bacterium SCN 57-15]|nr:MAG: hypothetical protein ABS95_01295 [Verrucomicrobia bacterium SCN 57-15]